MKKQIVLAMMTASLFTSGAHAAVGSAKALMKVLTSIAVTKDSDLIFDEATAGSSAESIPAVTEDSAKNASFTITG